MDKRILVTGLLSAVGGGVIGGAITYLTVKKTIAARADRDIEEVKQAYAEKFDGKRVVNEYVPVGVENVEESTPISHLKGTMSDADFRAAKEFAERLQYNQVPSDDDISQEDVVVNIADRTEEPVGEELESPLLIGYDREALKAAGKPYLISSEEFYTTENEWSKVSFAYYEDDDILADESDKHIRDVDQLIGEKHLDFFGIRSGDDNIVFVRNGQLSTDIEITRNLGSYTEIVLNVPKEPRAASSRRMRAGDDG